jgi:hypothetical protein
MNIDFHYGIIYVVSRLAGLAPIDAETVAHACQYVDDTNQPGVLLFEDGQSYDRFVSAHKMIDYANFDDGKDRLVWAPFHFLPGNQGDTFEKRVVCRPDSAVAREMVRRFLIGPRRDNDLHRLGILLHTYVDTWAHQGFSGTISDGNCVAYLDGHEHDHATWYQKLTDELSKAADRIQSEVVETMVKVGHGAALHFPDLPWAKWSYTNGFGEAVERDNLPDFVCAATMAYKVIAAFRAGIADFAAMPDMAKAQIDLIRDTLGQDQNHDAEERLFALSERLGGGAFPELPEAIPVYIAKGPGSWKEQATGLTTVGDGDVPPVWSPAFERSDYRKFHDAVKEHRMDVTQYLLPQFGLRLA